MFLLMKVMYSIDDILHFDAISFQKRKREDSAAVPQWKLIEWARQLHDLERYLAFCNRRNNVSKIRLL